MKILAVSESAENATALKAAVERLGHQVDTLTKRRRKSDVLAAGKYDALVGALHFSDESAFEFLRTIRRLDALKHVPFILCCLKPNTLTHDGWLDSTRVAAQTLGCESVLLLDSCEDADLEAALRNVEARKSESI
jgi:CheY-like chemotaxis protein